MNHGAALIHRVIALPQYQVGEGPILADGAAHPQKGLLAPFIQDGHNGFPAIGGQGPGGAKHEAVHGLGGSEKIKGEHKPDPHHASQEIGGAVVNLDVARHCPDFGTLQQGRQNLLEGIGFDDTVRIHGDEILALALEKSGVQGFPLAPVLGKANSLDQVGVALPGPLDIVPGVVPGAVVDADDLQKVLGVVGGGH